MHVGDRIVLDHLDRLTDSTGLVQHAIYCVPRRESGYTTDDNARALRLCVRLWDQHPEQRMLDRVTVYLSFLELARGVGRGFHNFLSYDRHWLDAEGCGDCQGQALRALAELLASRLPDDYHALARELIDAALPTLADLRSLRAQAYVILAWGHLWAAGVEDIEPLEAVAWSAARRLVDCYYRALRPDWQWFESRMTYANAVLPHALFVAAKRWPKEDFLDIAQASFAFLDDQTTVEGVFSPIGNEGWYPRGGQKAPYDQQPVEAATMAEAALAALNLFGDEDHLATFGRAHRWFHGENTLGQPLAADRSGACRDGLQASGVNRNQGAESTLAYLWTELSCSAAHRWHGDHRKTTAVSR
ncbi:MAG: hypothetical protein ABSG68_13550 [Thermoguttaceae bacterium]|jgi:hypothetical protein